MRLFYQIQNGSFQNGLAQLINNHVDKEDGDEEQRSPQASQTNLKSKDSLLGDKVEKKEPEKAKEGAKASGDGGKIKKNIFDELKLIMDKSKCYDIF